MDYPAALCRLVVLGIFLLSGLMPAALADPMDEWKSWALDNHPQHDCPWILGNNARQSCIWPGRLSLEITGKGGRFSFDADVFGNSAFVQLPGDTAHWPATVTISDVAAPVVERDSLPYLSLSAGKYTIEGRFEWQATPSQMTLPTGLAVIALTVDGQQRPANLRDGQLIFSGSAIPAAPQNRDSLKIEVYRKLIDGVPLRLDTVIKLAVSGKTREVSFGQALLQDSEIMRLQSPIPARVEADGSIRAQVSAGEHEIRLLSRFLTNPQAIEIKPLTSNWPQYEYVSFQANPAVRQAKLSGPISIDTSQIPMPADWADLPTYRLAKDDPLTIATEYRGDHSPAANILNITRDLWLDFSGDGITSLDSVSGSMNRGWRLDAATGTSIGRATVDGAPVLITSLEGVDGIEIRSPSIALSAVTRTAAVSDFSASGWAARADSYSATLHLPPGWRVLHASGVDHIVGSWVSQWDLWDVFLVLVIIAATRKLIGNAAAAVAAITLLLSYHEPGSPLLLIPLILVVSALLPVASGRVKSLLSSIGVVLTVVMTLSLIAFAVNTFRLAIYPSLERAAVGDYSRRHDDRYQQSFAQAEAIVADQPLAKVETAAAAAGMGEVVVTAQQRQKNPYQLTETDRVQTGPGLPTWTWNAAYFSASGPVAAEQQLVIYYSSPVVTSLWRVVSVFLVALYAALVLSRLGRQLEFKSAKPAPVPATVTACIVAILAASAGLTTPQSAHAADFPPQYLLQELEQRLTKAPECLPGCASLNNGLIQISGSSLRISFDAYADSSIALPLPTADGSWQLAEVLVDGKPAPLRVDNNLLVSLKQGSHRIEVVGTLTGDNAALSLPLPIHNIQTHLDDWLIEGLVDGRARGNSLTLRSVDETEKQEMDSLQPNPAPAFVSIHRHFDLSKQWRVYTTVTRSAPAQGAISITVPLLANEQLLSDIGAVENGAITLQLGYQQQAVSWSSSLDPVAEMKLSAPQSSHFVEQWTFTPSSLWRLDYAGIPPVKDNHAGSSLEPSFKPWPGEQLSVSIRRPAGVAGPTHTVEAASLRVAAGKQLQQTRLTLDILSSLGEDYTLTLPEEAEVLAFSVNDRAMNIPEGNRIKVPLQPGSQQVQVEFQQPSALRLVSTTPLIGLPDSATNIELFYTLPQDRWPLYLSGPAIGPAMLFWGVLCVIVLAAIALPFLASRLGLRLPVTVVGWLLLGLGLSTVNLYGVLVIAVMFFLLAARKQFVDPANLTRFKFNVLQCMLILWVMVALASLLSAIPMGLLSDPDMQVVGNGSSSHLYQYYQDIARPDEFPSATVISVPITAYRIVMLLWSLWIATKLMQWAGWVWGCLSEKTLWKGK